MALEAELLHHVDQSGQDVARAVDVYERVYGSDDISIGDVAREGFTFRYRALGDEKVVAGTSSVQARRWGTINQPDHYVLAWATGPGITIDTSGDPIPMQPGIPIMYPARREFLFECEPATHHLIRFDAAFLDHVAGAFRGDVATPLTFVRSPGLRELRALRGVIAESAKLLLDPRTAPAERDAADARIAEAVVAAFDATPRPGLVRAAGPRSIRLAQQFIVANAGDRPTVTDIAAAVGLSVRSLQMGFHQHVGMSPTAFLRRAQLRGVHAALRNADATSTTVAEQAGSWGFSHLGRFAGEYVQAYGERPSETLRDRRRSA